MNFLRNESDPLPLGIVWRVKSNGLSADENLAGEGSMRIDPIEDLHQSGFAGAVLPDHRMNLASRNSQRDIAERSNPGKIFADADQFESKVAHRLSLVLRGGAASPPPLPGP